MFSNRLFCVLILCLTVFSIAANAGSDYLSVRQLPDGKYEAVLSLNSKICVQVNPASSVQINGSEILIVSPPKEQLPCIFVPPITYYEETAYIGDLARGNYTVTWSQEGAFSWSTSFAADRASAIPSNSLWSLLMLIFSVLAVAMLVIRSRSSSSQT